MTGTCFLPILSLLQSVGPILKYNNCIRARPKQTKVAIVGNP